MSGPRSDDPTAGGWLDPADPDRGWPTNPTGAPQPRSDDTCDCSFHWPGGHGSMPWSDEPGSDEVTKAVLNIMESRGYQVTRGYFGRKDAAAIAVYVDDLRAKDLAERDAERARAESAERERDEAGLRWGAHYNAALAAERALADKSEAALNRVRELRYCDGWESLRRELDAVIAGECGYGHCYCGGCVL